VGVLEARDVVKTFVRGGTEVSALAGVSLTVEAGEAVAITGPSGAGKSTLLHLLGAMDRPTSGSVRIDGRDTAAMSDQELTVLRRRTVGFVFQFFHLLPALSALDNVAVPALLDGTAIRAARRRAADVLATVGMAGRAEHRPAELSGGELQRVAIARALLCDPAVVLADEPTGNLDTATGTGVLEVLRGCTVDAGRTLVLVSHDPIVAESAHRVLALRDGVIADGVTA
jgi:putative ABC transport system ATP-binding protein